MTSEKKALEIYDLASRLAPKNIEALLQAALIQKDLGLSNESIDSLEKAIEIDPKNSVALWELGLAKHLKAWFEDATEIYEKILSIDPTFPNTQLHCNLASIYRRKGHYGDAKKVISLAASIDPHCDG